MNAHDRAAGALWGALVGDALGVPVEFKGRATVQADPVTGMRGFGTHHQPAGTWSDDSSLSLCTIESLTARGGFDAADLAERFIRWKRDGHWTPHGSVFDIGIATSEAISRLAAGTPPEEAGGADEYSNGNGSLMRMLPVALWFCSAPAAALAEVAHRASALTHRHLRSQMACTLYCLLQRELLHGAAGPEALATALTEFRRIYQEPAYLTEMSQFGLVESAAFAQLPEAEIRSSGYVIHTLTASLWCLLTSHSFEETVLKAVNLGGDTDTTGTVAGALAGACYGLAAIPPEWKRQLARHDEIASLFERFVAAAPSLSIHHAV